MPQHDPTSFCEPGRVRALSSRAWREASDAALSKGDDLLSDDDLDGACRHYLLAAYCAAQAWLASDQRPDSRARHGLRFHYAWQAARPLLPAR